MAQVYSTALSNDIIRTHRKWTIQPKGTLSRTRAFLEFAWYCDREHKDILSVVDQLS